MLAGSSWVLLHQIKQAHLIKLLSEANGFRNGIGDLLSQLLLLGNVLHQVVHLVDVPEEDGKKKPSVILSKKKRTHFVLFICPLTHQGVPCILSHVFVGRLHGLCGEAHVFEHFRVGVGILQRLPLELDGWQRAVNLGQLLLVPLLSFQSLQRRWGQTEEVWGWAQTRTRVTASLGIF